MAALDQSFVRHRFDPLTPSGKRYLRATSEPGPGHHRPREVSSALKQNVTSFGPDRSRLIGKCKIWSPGHGDTGFTVPHLDELMRRIMPGGDWKA